MRETRLESVLALRVGGLTAPVAAYLVARVADAIAARPRIVALPDVRVREDGVVRLARRDGSPPFDVRAPEVARGGAEGDPRAAVFALGVLLVHASLGRSPFARGTDLETRMAVGEEEVPPLVGRAGKASAALDAIVARACAKTPSERHGSPAALRDALDGYLEDELHGIGPRELAEAVREAIERAPSDDRTSMPDYDDAELALAPQAPKSSPPAESHFEDGLVRLGDPLASGGEAGITEASLTGVRDSGPRISRPALEVDDEAVAREKEARVHRTLAPIGSDAPPGPNWLLRIGVALAVLLALAIAYRFVLRPLLGD